MVDVSVAGPRALLSPRALVGRVTAMPLLGVGSFITLSAPNGGVETFNIDRSGNVIALTLLTNDVPHQPGALSVTVGNGPANGTAYFFLDGSSSSFFNVPLDAVGAAVSIAVPINALTVATHALAVGSASGTPEATSSTAFTVDEAAATTTVPTPGFPAAVISGRWTLQAYSYLDPAYIPSYEFALNPDKLSQVFGEAAVSSKHVVANDGTIIVWEGEPRPTQWTFSGHVLSNADHDALVNWAAANDRCWLTDEFGRRYLIKIDSLKMVRRRDLDRAWTHDYTIVASILAGQGVMV